MREVPRNEEKRLRYAVYLCALLLATTAGGKASPQLGAPKIVSEKAASQSLVHSVAPIYPDDARQARIEGTVVLNIVIGTDGSVESLKVISGPPSLAPAAAAAVRQWRYKPYLMSGKPVQVDTTVNVVFALSQPAPDTLPCAKAAPDGQATESGANAPPNGNAFQQATAHFQAGMRDLQQARDIESALKRATSPDLEQLREKFGSACGEAVDELRKANQAAAPDQKTNHATILSNLASAYALARRHDDAAAAYQQAIEWEPSAALYSNMSAELAKQGNATDAKAACEKAGGLSAQESARCWGNLGITLYNSANFKEAVGFLEQAASSDPQNALGWYLLGDSLRHTSSGANNAGAERSRIVAAFQKYLQLAPNGPYAERAKSALKELQ